jgi:hypothetical protein
MNKSREPLKNSGKFLKIIINYKIKFNIKIIIKIRLETELDSIKRETRRV